MNEVVVLLRCAGLARWGYWYCVSAIISHALLFFGHDSKHEPHIQGELVLQ